MAAYDASQPLIIDPVLSYSTYLGGSDDEFVFGIAVDAAGNAHVAGYTRSNDFPTTPDAFQTSGGGSTSVYITKLNATGNAVIYSAYIGGCEDLGLAIAVDASGNSYVTGFTRSTDFPTASPIQAAYGGGGDAFVTKLNADGSALVYSTYLGGDGPETVADASIAVDSSGNVYVAGTTASNNFPTASPIQSTRAGLGDAFVAKLNAAGDALVYSTYLGGTNSDSCRGIAADSAGNTYVSGRTFSPDFPTTLGAPFIGCFVTKFNATGSALVYSTFESGFCGDIAVDSAGNAYSPLVTKLNAAGDALVYSMHLGGKAIAVDASGNAYVTGSTRFNFPPTVNPIQPNIAGGQDTFIAKITDEPPGPPTLPANSVVNGASFRPATEPNSAIAPGAIVAIFGADLASETVLAGEVPLPTTLGETSVTFDNILASLFFISRVQINAQVPFELTTGAGSVTVQVTRGSETTEAQPTEIAAVSPGIFTLNQQGSGPAAILHAEDFQPVTASASAQPGEFLAIFCTGLGPVQPEVASGDVAPSTEPLARTVTLPMVNIAGIAADVTFSGLAPGFVGLYQVNVQVPSGVPVDVQDVEVIINGVSSQIVTVHVAS